MDLVVAPVPLWTLLTIGVGALVVVGWLALALAALRQLGRRELDETSRALWAVLIVLVPFGGAIGFFLAHPGLSGARRAGDPPTGGPARHGVETCSA